MSRLIHVVTLGFVSLVIAACGSSSTTTPSASATASVPACVSGTTSASGSTALQPLVQKAAQLYQTKCPGATITVAGGGSSVGLTNVASGTSDIGNSDVPVSNSTSIAASSLTDHQVAVVVFAVVVNPAAGVSNLSTSQVQKIFSGETTNWQQVGGHNVPITLIERKTGSGSRLAFDKDMMNSTPESTTPASSQDSTQLVVQAVTGAPGGVSYINVASATSGVTAVSLDNVKPTGENVKNGTYPLFAHEHMYTKTSASQLAQSFIAFILSSDFQSNQVSHLGYLPTSATTSQAAADK